MTHGNACVKRGVKSLLMQPRAGGISSAKVQLHDEWVDVEGVVANGMGAVDSIDCTGQHWTALVAGH